MESSVFRLSKYKIISIILLLLFIPLFAMGYGIYSDFIEHNRQKIEQQVIEGLTLCGQNLNLFLKERKTILSAIAKSSSFDYYNNEQHLLELFNNINKQIGGGLIDIGIIDSHGVQISYVGPYNLEGMNYSGQSWFKKVMKDGLHISDIFMGHRNLPHFVTAVKFQSGKNSSIFKATMDSNMFTKIIRQAMSGKTGDAFIINSNGIYQSPSRFNREKMLDNSGIDVKLFDHEKITIIKGKKGFGKNRIYAGKWIKNGKWLLIVSSNVSESADFFPAKKYKEIVVFLMALVLLLTALFQTNKLKKFDDEFKEINAQLLHADKLTTVGRLASGIAHEINNPLGVILSKAGWMKDILEVLEEDESMEFGDYQDDFFENLQKIEKQVMRVDKTIENTLSFARKSKAALEKININDVLDQTMEFLDYKARKNHVALIPEYDESLPDIISDQSQLQHVFVNIVNNAIDAIEENGTIHIKTEKKDKHLVIQIQDTGGGIPDEIINKISTPFFTTKEKGKGTGLGLTIAYKIIDNLKGTISVKSEKNQGTTFTIFLPV